MIYDELLNFLASNYLSRTEALNLVNQSTAGIEKNNFDLLKQTVLDLAGQNATYFGCIVTIFAIFIGIPIFWERKRTKDILKNMEVLENNMQEQEEKINEIKNNVEITQKDYENSLQRNEERLSNFVTKLERNLLEQNVSNQYNLYLSVWIQKKPFYTLLAYIKYLISEYYYYDRHHCFSKLKDFNEILENMRRRLSDFKKNNARYHEEEHAELKEVFKKFASKSEFKEGSTMIVQEFENLLNQPSPDSSSEKNPKT